MSGFEDNPICVYCHQHKGSGVHLCQFAGQLDRFTTTVTPCPNPNCCGHIESPYPHVCTIRDSIFNDQLPTDPTPRATAAVIALGAGLGADKHGEAWRTRDDRIDASHANIHEVRYFSEDHTDYDEETGVLHIVHEIQRLKFILERRLIRDEERANGD